MKTKKAWKLLKEQETGLGSFVLLGGTVYRVDLVKTAL